MRIIWLCHFINEEIKGILHCPEKKSMAPWINNLICIFSNCTEIELHIVSPNLFNNIDCEIYLNGIHYHFFKYKPSFTKIWILEKLYNYLRIDYKTKFNRATRKIVRIVNDINPNLIHLHGAENPYYSAGTIHLLKNFQVLLTVQGFSRLAFYKNKEILLRSSIEEKIIKKCHHFGIRTENMSQVILSLNPNAKFYFHNYPITIPNVIKDKNTIEKFDIIFFARISKDKGIEDLLYAIEMIKKNEPNVSAIIIGETNSSYNKKLQFLIKKLKIKDNIKFLGFIGDQQKIFKICVQAKICVLPTYNDTLPNTVIESFFMKLPVIAYSVGGIPELNLTNDNIFIVEKHNITELAERVSFLLKNPHLREKMADRAYKYANTRFDNSKIKNDLLMAYSEILNS